MQTTSSSTGSAAPRAAQGHTGSRVCIRRAVLGLLVVPVVLAASGAIYQLITSAIDRRAYPPPGQLVDVGGYRLHLFCTGIQIGGSPTVVLDASFPGTVSTWAWVQPDVARATRVCAYDRAGLGWSDRGLEPRDAVHHAQELHTLLQNAGIPGPYVLVGHSLGGLSVRLYADRYPDEVAGMVLIEGTNPDTWQRLGKPEGVGVDPNQLAVAPFLARLGVFRLGLIQMHGADPDLPPRQRAELQAFFNSSKYLETVRAVNASFSVALEQVRTADGIGSKPLGIVLGSNGDGGLEPVRDLFAQQAGLSTNSNTRMVEGATHAGLVDNREHAAQTMAIILAVVTAVRTGQPLPK